MTSAINPDNIDGNYPVAGVPNNTQGFRTNFTNTQTNFRFAAQEITDLQSKAILKAPLTGTTLNNDMGGNPITNVKLNDVSYSFLPVAATSGSIVIDYSAAQFQQINVFGNVSLSFTNWPATGSAGSVRVAFNITNTAFTVTLPVEVRQGLAGLQGVSPGTPGVSNTIRFGAVGNYAFEFATIDGGTTVWIFDNSRPNDVFSDRVRITANTVSNSAATGALVVTGGAGIGGNLYVAGNIVGNIQVTGVNVTGNVSGNVLIGNSGIIPNLTVNRLSSDDSSFVSIADGLDVNGDLRISGNISPASATKIGGISAGPGVVISNQGQLTIDTSGLPLSFGDFTASNNILSIVNADEDMILTTTGDAEIQLVGNIGFYKPNGGGAPNPSDQFFFARDDGQITILVPNVDPLLGAVEIVGSSTGNSISPGITGTMLHVTGQLNTVCRNYFDGNGDYVSIIGRRWNGNVAVPTQVLADQDVLRINATAATDAGMGNVAFAQISFHALENQTTTAQGSRIDFTVTPVGASANARVDVANITTANGVSATRVTSNNPTGGIGYITGAGGTVTQVTSKATGVTLNTVTGQITTAASALAGGATVTFVLTNSAIAATDVMIINHVSGGTAGRYMITPACGTGNASITLTNVSNASESAALVLRYAVIKGAVA